MKLSTFLLSLLKWYAMALTTVSSLLLSPKSATYAKYIPTCGSQNQIYLSSLFLKCPETWNIYNYEDKLTPNIRTEVFHKSPGSDLWMLAEMCKNRRYAYLHIIT